MIRSPPPSDLFPRSLHAALPILGGGEIESHDDHRIAMSFAVAALRATAPIIIHDCNIVATSFPGFVALCRSAGLDVEEVARSEEHTSELQSRGHLVCRLLL